MILGVTFEHIQINSKKIKKGPWHSESELQSFVSKKNHSPDKLGGVRLRIYVGECAQIKHSSKKGQS